MKKLSIFCVAAVIVLATSGVARAGFDAFVIREGGGNAPAILDNDTYVTGATEFVINAGSMKAGLGSNDINGTKIGDITKLGITRYDATSRFAAGSGAAVAPYFNIWVTDGLGNYAVVANEPSNGAIQSLFTADVVGENAYHTYDLSYDDLSDKVAKVYETPGWDTNSSWVHDLFGNRDLTFTDVASLTIAPPPASYIQITANGVGSGAPDVLDTDVAYGFNWVFGDTLSNYVSGAEGYVVGNAVVTPEPATLGLLGLGGLFIRRRRKA